MRCLSAKVLRPLDITNNTTPSTTPTTCINCPCLETSLVQRSAKQHQRLQQRYGIEEGNRTMQEPSSPSSPPPPPPSPPQQNKLSFESTAYKLVEDAMEMRRIKPTAFLHQTTTTSTHDYEEAVNPWNINRVELLKCSSRRSSSHHNTENNNYQDYYSPYSYDYNNDMQSVRSNLDRNSNSGLHKSFDSIDSDKMVSGSVPPSIQVTSPPRSPRPRHRIEMRKKDLTVDKTEVSTIWE